MKRAPGTGTVQFHNGRFRLRLPRSLDPTRAWLSETFRADQEAEAHAVMDACLLEQRARIAARERSDGVTFGSIWPKYVAARVRASDRRHEGSGRKTRARLDGMGENWLSKSPFWSKSLDTISGPEVEIWLEALQREAESAKGEPISSSWVAQCAASVRGVFRLIKRPVPSFEVDADYQKVQSALNLQQQTRFFQEVLTDPLDRVICGCQLGAGLRIGELLSLEVEHVHVGTDPHLFIVTGGPNRAPTKSGQSRRVELLEPGLGFFRLALEHHHRPNDRGLLFAGPQGGYRSDWPQRFVGWSKLAGTHLTTHDLRHSWAFSMLSGLWGYPPTDITFVSRQLGHSDIRTTQQAYGHWDPGVGLMTARIMRGEVQAKPNPVTAERLLGRSPRSPLGGPLSGQNPFQTGVGVDDGNPRGPGVSPGFVPDVAHLVAHEACALLEAAAYGVDPGPAAVAFLWALGDHPAALRTLDLVLDGDPVGIPRAVALAERCHLIRPEPARESTA